MKKFSILDLIITYFVLQTILVGLHRFEYINSLLIVLIPTILITLFFIIFGGVSFIMYKYINNGFKWFDKRKRD